MNRNCNSSSSPPSGSQNGSPSKGRNKGDKLKVRFDDIKDEEEDNYLGKQQTEKKSNMNSPYDILSENNIRDQSTNNRL